MQSLFERVYLGCDPSSALKMIGCICSGLLLLSTASRPTLNADSSGSLRVQVPSGQSFAIDCPALADDNHLACMGPDVEARDGTCQPITQVSTALKQSTLNRRFVTFDYVATIL